MHNKTAKQIASRFFVHLLLSKVLRLFKLCTPEPSQQFQNRICYGCINRYHNQTADNTRGKNNCERLTVQHTQPNGCKKHADSDLGNNFGNQYTQERDLFPVKNHAEDYCC